MPEMHNEVEAETPPRLQRGSLRSRPLRHHTRHRLRVGARFLPCWPAACEGVGFVCRFSLALALGVGHSRSNSVRFPPLDRVPEQARGVGQVVSLADGEDEEPLAPVGRAIAPGLP